MILQALQASGTQMPEFGRQRRDAIERLRTFGTTHGLSLGEVTIKDLLHEGRAGERP